MANLNSSKLVPLTIPTGGMSTRYPVVDMPPQYSPWIKDYDNEGGYYEIRKGMKSTFSAPSKYTSAIAPHPTNKNRIVCYDSFTGVGTLFYYDIIANTTAVIGSIAGSATPRALTTSFNKNAYFFPKGTAPVRYDGTTYAATGFTGPTMANVIFGFSYKSRMYLVESLSSSVWYGGIGFVTGATTQVDFASLTEDAGIIVCGFSFTLSSGLNSESLFALVFDTGEMLVFRGNYPDDVTSWTMVARVRIGSPLGYQSIIQQNGDVLILTKTGIVSVRELLTTAQGDVQAASITREIEKYWTQLISEIVKNDSYAAWDPNASLLSYVNGVFHAQRNKLIIFLPKYLFPELLVSQIAGYVYESNPAMLVYDIPTRSWVVHVPQLISSNKQFISAYYWATFGKLFFGSNEPTTTTCWEYWGNAQYVDTGGIVAATQNYTPALKTAFTNIGSQALVKGIYITHQGPYAKGQCGVQLVSDSGANYTPVQKTQTPNTVITRDFYDVGITGENLQVSLSTQTDISATMTAPYRILGITAQMEITRSPT